MIYTPFGCECKIVARESTGTMLLGEYVTVTIHDDEMTRQYRVLDLRADDGYREIARIVEAL